MKLLFLMAHAGFVRNFEWALEHLADRGHAVHVALEPARPGAGGHSSAGLEALARRRPHITWGHAPPMGADGASVVARRLRAGADLQRYLEPGYGAGPPLVTRAAQAAPAPLRWLAGTPEGRSPRLVSALRRGLQAAERALPWSAEIDAFLAAQAPDALLVTPLVELSGPQTPWVRAARHAAVPSALCTASWDNLTNKGLIHEPPDRVLVWNAAQGQEATHLHGVPAERVVVTGAHAYDHWFGWEPAMTRAEFCAQVGLPEDRPFILYVCSSPFIGAQERKFVRRWATSLRASSEQQLRSVGVLVRPHPQNAGIWHGVDLSDLGPMRVWPPQGADPVDVVTRSWYFDSLYHCAAVVGVNTSALVESAIVGRPVYTVLDPQLAGGQAGTRHFHHLRSEGGGLLHVAETLDEHADHLRGALGVAPDPARGRGFVEAFIRPHGLEASGAERLANAVEQLAREGPAGPPTSARQPRHRHTAAARALTAPAGVAARRLPPSRPIPGLASATKPEVMRAPPAVPRVVIGVPMHNGASHVEEAVGSLLTQVGPELRMVLVDDASTDGTADIVARLVEEDERASLHRNPRRLGMVANWQRAFSLARELHPDADLFAWGSDHDIWDPGWLRALVQELDEHSEAVLAYPRAVRVDACGAPVAGHEPPPLALTGLTRAGVRLSADFFALTAGDAVYGLARAAAIERAGGFRPVPAPDRLLLAELLREGALRAVDRPLWRRRFSKRITSATQRRTLFADAPPPVARLPWPVAHAAVLARRDHRFALRYLALAVPTATARVGLRGAARTVEIWAHTRAVQRRSPMQATLDRFVDALPPALVDRVAALVPGRPPRRIGVEPSEPPSPPTIVVDSGGRLLEARRCADTVRARTAGPYRLVVAAGSTAIDAAERSAPGDVVYLDAGAEVSEGWLDGLRSVAYSRPDVREVVPFCCRLPSGVDAVEAGRVLRRLTTKARPPLADGPLPPCRYLRRTAPPHGLRIIDDATFVGHERTVGDGELRDRLLEAVTATGVPSRPVILIVIHDGQGGVPHTTGDLASSLGSSFDCLVLRCGPRAWRLERWAETATSLERLHFASPWSGRRPLDDQRIEALRSVCDRYGVQLVHLRSLLGLGPEALPVLANTGASLIVSFHDFQTVCPTVHLVDGHGRYCAGRCESGGGECRPAGGWFADGLPPLRGSYVYEWQRRMAAALDRADAFVTTSRSTSDLISEHFPAIAGRLHIIPHGRDTGGAEDAAATPPSAGVQRVVAFGSLSAIRGRALLDEVMRLDRAGKQQFEFHLLGEWSRDWRPDRHGAVLHAPYRRGDLPAALQAIRPSYALIGSIWAETYSHTLTEAWMSGLPVFASDLGAPAERIRAQGGGWLLDYTDPERFYASMLRVATSPQEWSLRRAEVWRMEPRTVDNMALDYRHLYEDLLHRARSVGTR